MVADVLEGRSIAFAMPQQAGGTTVTRTGCLLYKDMHFILQDDATTEVIELNGADLRTNTGRRVQITGAPTGAKPAVSIATGVMNVSNVAPISSGGCLTVASALDAKTEAPAAANSTAPNAPAAPAGTAPVEKHGMSTGAKAAIIIAVAGGGGAAAAIGISGGKKSTTSP